MKELFERIIKCQMNFHVFGGSIAEKIELRHETKNGTTIILTATRLYTEHGLSYSIVKEFISISKGYKAKFIGTTHAFGRENVILN